MSVVIPTRDRWDLLSRRALRGALMQEDVEHEVIVVDDGSTDETAERLRSMTDDRVRILRHETAGGAARARNAGIREARGEWIAFLDDDDYWAPRKLRMQLDLVRSTRADFAYAGVVTVDDRGFVLHTSSPPDPDRLRYEIIRTCAIPAGSSNVLARTEVVRQLGGFDESFRNMEDWDLWIRLASAGDAAALSDVLVACVEHRGGKAVIGPRDAFVPFHHLERKHRRLSLDVGVEFDRVAFSHYVAWLQLRSRRHTSAARVYLTSAIKNRRPEDLIPALKFTARALAPTRRTLRRRERMDFRTPHWLQLYE
ncbi:MAG: glycosyltransferase family 2 protein [Gaiellaceae bacterium]